MREIKFRAWGKNIKEFLGPDGYPYGLTLKEIQNIEDIDLWEFQQFTGLKDKNGKEVYEWDILKYEETGSFGVMTWLGKTAQFGFSNGWANPVYGYTNVNEAVIIGNIFENPELINHALT